MTPSNVLSCASLDSGKFYRSFSIAWCTGGIICRSYFVMLSFFVQAANVFTQQLKYLRVHGKNYQEMARLEIPSATWVMYDGLGVSLMDGESEIHSNFLL